LNPKYTPNAKAPWESLSYCSCDDSLTSSYSKEDNDDTNEPSNNISLSQSMDQSDNQQKENNRRERFYSCSSNTEQNGTNEAASTVSNMMSESLVGDNRENDKFGYSNTLAQVHLYTMYMLNSFLVRGPSLEYTIQG